MRPIQYASNDMLPARAASSLAAQTRDRQSFAGKIIDFGLASLGTFAIVCALSTVTVMMIAR